MQARCRVACSNLESFKHLSFHMLLVDVLDLLNCMSITFQDSILTLIWIIEVARDAITLLSKLRARKYFEIYFNLLILCINEIGIAEKPALLNMQRHRCRYNYRELTIYFGTDSCSIEIKTILLRSEVAGKWTRVSIFFK